MTPEALRIAKLLTEWSKPELVAEIEQLRTQLAAAQAAMRDHDIECENEQYTCPKIKGGTAALDAVIAEARRPLEAKLAMLIPNEVIEIDEEGKVHIPTTALNAAIDAATKPLVDALKRIADGTEDYTTSEIATSALAQVNQTKTP